MSRDCRCCRDEPDTEADSSPDQLTVTFHLDGPHGEMVRQLRDAGYNVEAVVRGESQPTIEQAIYNSFQQSKYEQSS